MYYTDESYLSNVESSPLSDSSSTKEVSEPIPLQKVSHFQEEPSKAFMMIISP